ncbi:hypothetical protein [Capnocytophaga cynodegmi]
MGNLRGVIRISKLKVVYLLIAIGVYTLYNFCYKWGGFFFL